jgi:hypothetical protein
MAPACFRRRDHVANVHMSPLGSCFDPSPIREQEPCHDAKLRNAMVKGSARAFRDGTDGSAGTYFSKNDPV